MPLCVRGDFGSSLGSSRRERGGSVLTICIGEKIHEVGAGGFFGLVDVFGIVQVREVDGELIAGEGGLHEFHLFDLLQGTTDGGSLSRLFCTVRVFCCQCAVSIALLSLERVASSDYRRAPSRPLSSEPIGSCTYNNMYMLACQESMIMVVNRCYPQHRLSFVRPGISFSLPVRLCRRLCSLAVGLCHIHPCDGLERA